MSHGQAPETSRAGSAAFYFASDRPCVGPAEVRFVAKLTGEGLADSILSPIYPAQALRGTFGGFRNFPKIYYS